MYQAANDDGSKRWLCSINASFVDANATDNGAKTVHWKWEDGVGIACISSHDPEWGAKANGGALHENILSAAPEPVMLPTQLNISQVPEIPGPFTTIGEAGDFSAFVKNGQWPFINLDAVTLNPGATPDDPYDAPSFDKLMYGAQLLEGAGVTIGDVGYGVPSLWTAPPNMGGVAAWDSDPASAILHPAFDAFAGAVGDPADANGGVIGFDIHGSHPNPLITDPFQAGSTSVAGIMCSRAVGTPTIADSSFADKASVKGRMRGLAPCAKLICYSLQQYDSAGKWLFGGWFFGDFLRAMEKAITHNVNVLHWHPSIRISEAVSQNEGGEVIRNLLNKALNKLHANDILVVSTSGTQSINQDDTNFLITNEFPNLLVASGVAPRAYDPFSSNLSAYVPTPGTPKGRVNNVDRLCHQIIDYGPFMIAGYGANIGHHVEVAAPGGTVDGSEAPAPLGQFNSLVYTTLPIPGSAAGVPFTQGIFGNSLGDHGYAIAAESSYSAATAALTMESYKLKNAAFPSVEKLKHLLLKTADKAVGPETERWIFNHAAPSKKFPMPGTNQTVKNVALGHPDNLLLSYSGIPKPAQYFATVAGGIFLLVDWTIIDDPDFAADRPGRDKVFGHGRLNAKSAVEEAAL